MSMLHQKKFICLQTYIIYGTKMYLLLKSATPSIKFLQTIRGHLYGISHALLLL